VMFISEFPSLRVCIRPPKDGFFLHPFDET
jgi:hypothetical protein